MTVVAVISARTGTQELRAPTDSDILLSTAKHMELKGSKTN